jgi:ATP-dependent helicase/DNAse subunit B
LATDPRHRPVLEGTATALLITADRLGGRTFSEYDGRLADPAAVAAIAARYNANYLFSASQLESYLTCPFQFFVKYVLGLSPVNERDDLDEDFIQRGNRLHRLLEELELRLAQEGGDREELCESVIRAELNAEWSSRSDADPGLYAIERRRVEQSLRRYTRQMIRYQTEPKALPSRPARFEVAFGSDSDDGEGTPWLVIGEGPSAVRLQGKIDRVDVVETDGGTAFRVIDYKTGSCPPARDVRELVMVQLPLYALAVERLSLLGETGGLADLGYWALRDGGYKKIKLDGNWPAERERLEARVVETAERLRSGLFVIQPKKDDCDRTCDYAMVCRIGQVRRASKRVDAP